MRYKSQKKSKRIGRKIVVRKLLETGDSWYLNDISPDSEAAATRIDGNEISYIEVSDNINTLCKILF